jgi:hypothetical protein
MKQQQNEDKIIEWILFLIIINTIMLAIVVIDKPVILIEEKNQTCNQNIVDTSYGTGRPYNSSDLFCYSTPSKPKCDYILLKNGTKISKGNCFMTFNYVVTCINKSLVKGEVTE